MSSNHWRITLVSLLVAGWSTWADATVKVGEIFPPLTAFGLQGRVPATKGKVVVVDFWASWCAPCKESFPALERLQKAYQARGLEVVAINVDTKREAMDRFLESYPVSFSVVRDASKRMVEWTKPEAMPTSLVIDRAGRVVAVHAGFKGEETEKALIEEIEKCLQ